MDSARLGRVLGAGARGAAKTLVSAVDAASAPKPRSPVPDPRSHVPDPRSPIPNPRSPGPATASSSRPASAIAPASRSAEKPASPASTPQPSLRTASSARDAHFASFSPSQPGRSRSTPAGIAEGSRRFGAAVTAPMRRLSGVLWLEFTGVFFGLFAFSAAVGAWRLRSSIHAAPGDPARTRLLLALSIAVVFAYFCLSSFVRAARRGRQG